MRIASGTVDQYIYFVAVDATDLKTRETGLSSFTVYRSRNGGAAAAFTTPTVNETDSSNMPGVYELLLDEDMTIDSGDVEQAMVFHITATGMAPVTIAITLFRPVVTAGETLTVSSGNGNAAVQSIANNAITAASIATGAIDADAIADNAIDAGAIAANAITSAKIATGAITNATFAAGAIDAAAIAANAIGASELAADAVAEIADAVWDEDATGHQTGGTFGQAIGDPGADTNTIYGAVVTGAAGATVAADIIAIKAETASILTDTAEIGAAGAGLTEAGGTGDHLTAVPWNAAWDAEVESEVTDALNTYDPPTKAELDTAVANVSVDEIQASALADLFNTDSGTTYASAVAGSVVAEIADNAGGSALTAAAIADAVWDEAQADHVTAGSFGETATEIAAILVDTGTTLDGKIDTIDTVVDAVKAKTDSLTFTVAGVVDSNVQHVNDTEVTGNGQTGTEWGPA